MMTKKLSTIAVAALLAAPLTSYAAPVSFGALSSDDSGSTQVIQDSLNNLEWMRWDVLSSLSFDETLAAISKGGQFEGQRWAFAYEGYAQMFTNALLQGLTNSCTVTGEDTCNSTLPNNLTALLGDNGGGLSEDIGFLSTSGDLDNSGYIQYVHEGDFGTLYKQNEFGSSERRGWLLFRVAGTSTPPPTSVPEPGTLGLIAAGIAIVGVMRRRRAVA